MTAGCVLIHNEAAPAEFKKKGGRKGILQLWLYLPARLKMTPPKYVGLQKDLIPKIQQDKGEAVHHPISGNWKGIRLLILPLTSKWQAWCLPVPENLRLK